MRSGIHYATRRAFLRHVGLITLGAVGLAMVAGTGLGIYALLGDGLRDALDPRLRR